MQYLSLAIAKDFLLYIWIFGHQGLSLLSKKNNKVLGHSNESGAGDTNFFIPIPVLRLVLCLVDFNTDTRKSENLDSDSNTNTKVKAV